MKDITVLRTPENIRISVNAHTAFHLASVSKTFTAMAILKLWEEGKLDIHDDISKYLTGFPPGITIKNLLSQRSGLRNYVHFMDQSGWDKRKYLTQFRFVAIYYTSITQKSFIQPPVIISNIPIPTMLFWHLLLKKFLAKHIMSS